MNNTPRKMPKEIKKLLSKRRKLKRKGREKIEFTEISKLIRKKIKHWLDTEKVEGIRLAINEGSSLKKCLNKQSLGKSTMIALKDKDGIIKRDNKSISDIITSFYKQLYAFNGGEIREIDNFNELTSEESENTDVILFNEVENSVKKLKKGKAGGVDNVFNEHLKAGGATLIRELHTLFNECLRQKQIPDAWRVSKLLLLFKKGDKMEIKNYRPINLLAVIYKTFMSIITARITKQLDFFSPVNQIGFKKNFSTCDAILVLQQLITKAQDYNLQLVILFVDFEKAFDTIYHEKIFSALELCGINHSYIELLKNIYKNSKIMLKVGNIKRMVEIERGLRQGDVPSAKLFTTVLELIFKDLNWSEYGIKVNGENLNLLKFADDVVLIGKSKKEVLEMLNDLTGSADRVGLRINSDKTKLMTVNIQDSSTLQIKAKVIEEVE